MPEPTSDSVQAAGRLLSRLASLEGAVDRLSSQVEELASRLHPVEEHLAIEARERDIDAAVRERLQAAGVEVEDPITGVRPAPTSGWIREITDGAATTGGGRIIAGVVLVVLAVTAPELIAVVAPMAGLQPPISVQVEPALPDMRESPVDTGPRIDTPAAPRPTL